MSVDMVVFPTTYTMAHVTVEAQGSPLHGRSWVWVAKRSTFTHEYRWHRMHHEFYHFVPGAGSAVIPDQIRAQANRRTGGNWPFLDQTAFTCWFPGHADTTCVSCCAFEVAKPGE